MNYSKVPYYNLLEWLREIGERDEKERSAPTAVKRNMNRYWQNIDALLHEKKAMRAVERMLARELRLLLGEFIIDLNKENGDSFKNSTYQLQDTECTIQYTDALKQSNVGHETHYQ